MSSRTAVIAGKYRLTRLLGRGGMGSVWEGVHQTLGTRVAVKLIDAEHIQSADSRKRFENEARAAAKLQSKHVVEVYDYGVGPDGRPFIVMQYLSGEPLDKRLERVGRLPAADTARVVLQICRALAKAHSVGIVHRDLKPENVFLMRDEEDGADIAKVVDFGIAKIADDTDGESSTRTGHVLGTPSYMSPEQARGLRSVDHRTDLWSVAVIAFRCIVGRLPFRGEAVGDVLVNLCTGPIPVPSELAPDVPPGFDDWMARALSRIPAERFATASELGESLAALCGMTQRIAPITDEAPLPLVAVPEAELGQRDTAPAPAPARPGSDSVVSAMGDDPLLMPPAAPTLVLPTGLTGSPTTATPPSVQRHGVWPIVLLTAVGTLALVFAVLALLRMRGPESAAEAPSRATASPSLPVAAEPATPAPPEAPSAASPADSAAESAAAAPAESAAAAEPGASAHGVSEPPASVTSARKAPAKSVPAARRSPPRTEAPPSLDIRLQR